MSWGRPPVTRTSRAGLRPRRGGRRRPGSNSAAAPPTGCVQGDSKTHHSFAPGEPETSVTMQEAWCASARMRAAAEQGTHALAGGPCAGQVNTRGRSATRPSSCWPLNGRKSRATRRTRASNRAPSESGERRGAPPAKAGKCGPPTRTSEGAAGILGTAPTRVRCSDAGLLREREEAGRGLLARGDSRPPTNHAPSAVATRPRAHPRSWPGDRRIGEKALLESATGAEATPFVISGRTAGNTLHRRDRRARSRPSSPA